MATIETICLGNLRTEATHTPSGAKIQTDALIDSNRKEKAFSPTDLVATALSSCMMTIMDMFAQEHQLDLAGTRMVTEKVMSADPRRIGEIKIDIYFKGEFSGKQKTMLRRVANTCPVGKSLHPDLIQTITFHFEK